MSSLMRPRPIFSLISAIVLSTPLVAQMALTNARPSVRVTQRIDNAVRTPLVGTYPAIVNQATIGGRLDASTPVTHMRLLLSPSADQELALRTLMDQQQDQTSANYHHWLTPESFGQSFGAAPGDIAQISAWLQDQGFAVESVSKSNRIISFGGTVGQVETAFQTEIHHITVAGEAHLSNTTDLTIPAALGDVVLGIDSLNDFFPKSNAVNPHKDHLQFLIPPGNYVTPNLQPLYTSASSGNHYVAPGDAAVIFNSTPLLAASIDGTGQTIAVVGRSDITLSDVQQFRAMFGLKKNDPTFTIVDEDPGINTDDLEAYLDVEWAGGMAPGANVNFVIGGSDYEFSSGINVSGLYIVDNNIGDIVTMSYGGCETGNASTGTAFWNTLWQQAAAQGQSVFVSTGDSSAAGCTASNASVAGTAYGVNALGSSAYNVAVGGTMFVDYGPSTYWNAPNAATPFTTALSYVPEAAWNEGALTTTELNGASTATVAGAGIAGTGGGISIFTARPSWQTGSGISPSADSTCVSGTCVAAAISGSISSAPRRLVPDISLVASSSHVATIFCGEGVCQNSSAGYGIGAIGGTSVATPVMASIQALINQKNGGRQGNPNFHYYPLANLDYVAGNCKATNGTAASPSVVLPGAGCNFHDVVAGSNVVPKTNGDLTGLGFNAGVGYDSATGLGSVNVANVATNWNTVGFTATTTTFTLTPTTLAHGTAQTFSASVTAAAGTPTGDISIIAETTNPSAKLRYTLSAGSYSGSINGLPGGSYKVHVHYEGDGTFGSSDSASIPVTITRETSTTTTVVHYITGSSIFTAPTSVPYGVALFLNTTITSSGGSTNVPTGTIIYGVTLNGSPLPSLTVNVDGLGDGVFAAESNSTPFYIAANYPALVPGTYVITATYSGDSTFTASSTSSTFTVAKIAATITTSVSSAFITSGASVTFNYTAARPTGTYVQPTQEPIPSGTVTFTDTTTSTVLGSATLNAAGVATFATTGITVTGANSISAAYSGDTLYNSASSTLSVTVGSGTATTTTLTSSAGPFVVGNGVVLTATMSTTTAATVRFYDGTTLVGSATPSGGVANLTTTALNAGTRSLSAVYAGTSTLASSTGTLSLVIGQNPTSMALDAPVTSIYGQAVSMNGRVTRNPSLSTPSVGLTGTVTFLDGATAIATATPVYLPGGYGYYTATGQVPTLTAGTHSLTASYAGDGNYAASVSGTVSIVVSQLTPTVTLSTTSTAYSNSTTIPLTATIPLSSLLAAPTGALTFYDGATLLGSGVLTYNTGLNAYVATYSATTTIGASHNYSAQLAADTNYAVATSGTLVLATLTNNVWVVNGSGSVSALSNAGGTVLPTAVTGGGKGISIDGAGNVWSLNASGNSVAEFTKTGSIVNPSFTGGGITSPTALAIDGSGYVWIANGNNTLSVLNSSGTPVSTTAYTSVLSTPSSINVDGSGNLWITNTGDNSVTQVIGVAAPVITPQTTAVKNNTLAAKP